MVEQKHDDALVSIPGRGRFRGSRRQGFRFNGGMKPLPLHERGASAHDIASCVRVGVITMVTGDAFEDRLALAASGVDDTALGARLGRVGGGNVNQPPASGLQFVFQLLGKDAPALGKNGSVQARFLAHVDAWSFRGPLGACRHRANPEGLQRHDAKARSYRLAGDVQMVAAGATQLCAYETEPASLKAPSSRTLFATGQNALRAPLTLLCGAEIGKADVLTGRQAERSCNASVNTNRRKSVEVRSGPNIARDCQEPLIIHSPHRRGEQTARNLTGAPKLDPSKFGDADARPLRVQLLDKDLSTPEANAIVLAEPSWRGVAAPTEEGSVRLIQVVQRSLQPCLRDRGYPIELGPQRGEILALRCQADRSALNGTILAPKIAALFQSQIVDEARRSNPLAERVGLCGRWIKPECEAPMHSLTLQRTLESVQ